MIFNQMYSQNSWWPLGPNDSKGDVPIFSGTTYVLSAVADDNTLYAMNLEGYSRVLQVKKYSQGQWQNVGNDIGLVADSNCSIAAFNNNIYVAYHDYYGGYLHVKKFVNDKWVSLPIVREKVTKISLDIDSAGNPHVVYNKLNDPYYQLNYLWYDGSSWKGRGLGLATTQGKNPILKINRSVPNEFYVAFNQGQGNIRILRNSTNGQEDIVNGYIGTGSFDLDIANGNLYIGITSLNSSSSYETRVKKYSLNTWSELGNLGFTASQYLRSNLKIHNNKPYLFFSTDFEGNKASLVEFDGQNWNYLSLNQTFNPNRLNQYSTPNLVFTNNVPVVLYYNERGESFAKYYGKLDALSTDDSYNSENSKVLIYPNPVTKDLYFTKNITSASVFSLDGKKLNINFLNRTMDLSSLKKGTYILKIVNLDGNIQTQKIIKK